MILIIIFWDPFKIFFKYSNEDYNDIGANRESYCLRLLDESTDTISNFIIGNSRSLAYRTNYWSRKINSKPNSCFHYDGSGLGLYRLTNAVDYLCAQYQMKNLFIVFDLGMLSEVSNPESIFSIQPPEVSGIDPIKFYSSFIKASINSTFILSKIVYFFTNRYYDFMKFYIPTSKYRSYTNIKTGDYTFPYEKAIELDSIGYYNSIPKMYELYDRSVNQVVSEKRINNKQIILLEKLKNILEKEKVSCKLVISPLYDQVRINESDLEFLIEIFGEDNVFDFSGINDLTNKVDHYYENSHYKPFIANEIMDEVYSSN
jgi:hypothetical protein